MHINTEEQAMALELFKGRKLDTFCDCIVLRDATLDDAKMFAKAAKAVSPDDYVFNPMLKSLYIRSYVS